MLPLIPMPPLCRGDEASVAADRRLGIDWFRYRWVD